MSNYDAILIPGGGVLPSGDIPLWVRRRLDEAIAIHTEGFIITLSAGTTHKPPPVDSQGFPLFESVAGARYLMWHGIKPENILIECSSYDTIGNAYFARVIHSDVRQLRRLLVISSEFHIARTEAIFQWVFTIPPLACDYELTFKSVPNIGIDDEALSARHEKEQASLRSLREIINRYQTLPLLHEWLFSVHRAIPYLKIGTAMLTVMPPYGHIEFLSQNYLSKFWC